MSKKFLYLFKEGHDAFGGDQTTMKNTLGGKGAGLAEMTHAGMPVPQGFTITTEACTQYYEDGQKINDEIQAQIMELIRDLQKEIGMSVILITHDIGLVAQMADRVFVMYAGQIIEMASVKDLFYHPAHPYTKALLDTVPGIYDESGRTLASIPGIVPENYDQIPGCRFADRCAFAGEGCEKKQEMREIEKDHFVRCHKADRS